MERSPNIEIWVVFIWVFSKHGCPDVSADVSVAFNVKIHAGFYGFCSLTLFE